ncbi:hypothetical protein Metev_2353 (plasmid) [Methanohalobium evestigatum Z-7303]|uniref:Uncharacterized protein n=1 Tax=Methanohalobium evestigatum (strain ATCC BAA-1072 / DSM 3721 / NBRC 107634 / OCM 161 / Z-7303) TaxID=644295 RepID=D7EC41_METEZ|nr:hypothetical protein [Methanohalobium evestigatum]ADI75163.1 hypothetical protein Metev_2353 [Methanohalobium evestigatum Z-7303]
MTKKEQLNIRIDKELKDLVVESKKPNPVVVTETLNLYFYGSKKEDENNYKSADDNNNNANNQTDDNKMILDINSIMYQWVYDLRAERDTLKEQLKEKDSLDWKLTQYQQKLGNNENKLRLIDKLKFWK